LDVDRIFSATIDNRWDQTCTTEAAARTLPLHVTQVCVNFKYFHWTSPKLNKKTLPVRDQIR